MKLKLSFNSLDCIAVVKELQSIVGSRVNKVYDIDNKTYLIKLNKPNSEKVVLLIESGVRLHLTKCEWPKNSAPSGFTMKLRKHINNKRITRLQQVGRDRIFDIQFGSGEAEYHVILELYNRGNIILTDFNYNIMSLIRPYVDGDSFNFAVHEKYPIDNINNKKSLGLSENLYLTIMNSKKNLPIKKAFLPFVDLGSSLLEHTLIKAGFDPDGKVKSFSEEQLKNIEKELVKANDFLITFNDKDSKGYVLFEKELKEGVELIQMFQFDPFLFIQYENSEHKCFDNFNEAVDEYFSKIENQKIQCKILEREKEAMKKVNKIRQDQSTRLEQLSIKQQHNAMKAEVIMGNAPLVDEALNIMRSAIASQMSWLSIKDLVEEATRNRHPVASLISAIKLEYNQISMKLSDPYSENDEQKQMEVDLDLSLSAHANAKKYYDDKKHAAKKEKKTLDSQKKALKSAEHKARETLNTIKIQAAISKTRKVYWFEKFFWFISSENYLVIGGRDQKQNEVIVKRYMKPGDLYVHADLQGASSVIIKNPSAKPVPPRTLDEAGILAVCFSNAWSSKILFNAWWVYHHQVSKTAPSGEYLVTGSFMIRGQKNYLLPQHLQLGFSFLFKVDESCIERHINERKIKIADENFPDDDILKFGENMVTETLVEYFIDNEPQETESELLEVNALSSDVDDFKSASVNESNIEFQTNEDEDDNSCIPPENASNHKKKNNDSRVKKKKLENNVKVSQAQSAEKKHIDDDLRNQKYKRGQKSRLKKIKEKYKDQDEEEKQLRMSILKSAGAPKQNEKNIPSIKKSDKKNALKNKTTNVEGYISQLTKDITLDSKNMNVDQRNELSDEEDETLKEADELNMLSSLTGQPDEDDEILFALPIVAPYTAVLNNKYKVKMIPGMSKRGKAARAAVEMFLRSKECSAREKDVMKGVSDQLVTRNFPGKVKIITPQGLKR